MKNKLISNKDFSYWTLGTSAAPIGWTIETKTELTCPNCFREMPSKKHRRKHGCQWCVPKKNTPYCDGHYGK